MNPTFTGILSFCRFFEGRNGFDRESVFRSIADGPKPLGDPSTLKAARNCMTFSTIRKQKAIGQWSRTCLPAHQDDILLESKSGGGVGAKSKTRFYEMEP
jgi:hypothetical protein